MQKAEKIYCSLDIETSGFDPLTNEILEVGFVFFKITQKKFEITEEWTQVFCPERPVSPQIFGLTGITQAELDRAPKFKEYQKFLQEKLGKTVIVGHNIVFDIKFLESCGIKFSGDVIDTLDLVQFILPTHHSYNLENLMHTFGISHKEAHRALADSKATLKLLEKLLQVYKGFPDGLKAKIKKLTNKADFIWKELLETELVPLSFMPAYSQQRRKKPKASFAEKFKLESGAVYNFGLEEDYIKRLAALKPAKKLLLVLPQARLALDLYKSAAVDHAAFLPELLFDAEKLAAISKKKNLSSEEVKFLLKLTVWQEINWQNETLLDLNLSFFGGQFKALVSGGELSENKTAGVVACDLASFFYLSEKKLYTDRLVVICGLNELETAVTSNIGTKTSWGHINYLLKSYYNPELNTGQEKFKTAVEKGLLAGDLFFGLVNALLQTSPPGFQYFKISADTEHEERYKKIKTASASFESKISEVNSVLASQDIEKFLKNFKNFFEKEDNRVKWVELSEQSCSFVSMPLDITGLLKNTLEPFPQISFADALDTEILPRFFLKRLGLEKFKIKPTTEGLVAAETKKYSQGDLFAGIKKAFGAKSRVINYRLIAQLAAADELMEILKTNKVLPAAILFAGPIQVREFYEQNYQQLKAKAALLAQTNSGGSNKIFRNFSIHTNSLLLATDKFILKHLTGNSSVEPVSKLAVKSLVLCRLPFQQFTHPYQEAVSKSLANAFEDYALPRALYNFHSLIKFFYTPELTDIYVIDSKLSKAYAKVFRDYWKIIPGAVLKI
jgi:DNA polymerase III epsilon subunit family exonuclease